MLKRAAQTISTSLSSRPGVIFGSQKRVLDAVWRMLDLEAATWVVRRPSWLRATLPAPVPALLPSTPQAPLTASRADRIKAAYTGPIVGTGTGGDDIWGSLRNSHLAVVHRAFESGDAGKVRALAANLFRTSAVNGFSYGTTFDRWPHRWRYLPLQIELSAVSLAESLGIVRLENPEQGAIAGWRALSTPEALMDALEARLGFRIEHPRAGDPRGIDFGGRFLARETCSQVYTACRIDRWLAAQDLHGPVNVVEIGGGYGGLSYWMRKVLGSRAGRYAIIDLPEVSAIQALFLSGASDCDLALPGEDAAGRSIQLVINDRMEDLNFAPDLVINQDSLPEMPLAVAEGYLQWIAHSGARVFASFNHEAHASNSPRETQGWVSRMADARPEFERLSRELSWDRPGYVEEIYRIASSEANTSGGVED